MNALENNTKSNLNIFITFLIKNAQKNINCNIYNNPKTQENTINIFLFIEKFLICSSVVLKCRVICQ